MNPIEALLEILHSTYVTWNNNVVRDRTIQLLEELQLDFSVGSFPVSDSVEEKVELLAPYLDSVGMREITNVIDEPIEVELQATEEQDDADDALWEVEDDE